MGEVQLNEIAHDLSRLLAGLDPGQEVVVVDEGRRVATIRKESVGEHGCKAGSAKGKILYMADDFDEPIGDFKDYT